MPDGDPGLDEINGRSAAATDHARSPALGEIMRPRSIATAANGPKLITKPAWASLLEPPSRAATMSSVQPQSGPPGTPIALNRTQAGNILSSFSTRSVAPTSDAEAVAVAPTASEPRSLPLPLLPLSQGLTSKPTASEPVHSRGPVEPAQEVAPGEPRSPLVGTETRPSAALFKSALSAVAAASSAPPARLVASVPAATVASPAPSTTAVSAARALSSLAGASARAIRAPGPSDGRAVASAVVSSPVVSGPVVGGPVVASPVIASPVVAGPVVASPDAPGKHGSKHSAKKRGASGAVVSGAGSAPDSLPASQGDVSESPSVKPADRRHDPRSHDILPRSKSKGFFHFRVR
jgi:hypothetical protein